MPSVLGKRKLRSHEKSSATKTDTQQDPQDIFRRLFEQRFTPLEPAPSTRRPKHAAPTTAHDDSDDFDDDDTDEDGLDSDDDDDDTDLDDDEDGAGSEWGGVSDADGDSIDGSDEVEVVDHSCNPLASDAAPSMTKQELKAYMSSRPPSIATEPKQQPPPPQGRKSKKTAATAEDSADLLANDLALQRLLSESHLLSAATAGQASSSSATLLSSVAATPAAGSAAFAQGRLRRRTADLRMQALGSRESVFAQPAMPLAIRRGIAQHRAAREQRRRREARECGVILEAPSSSSSSSAKSRAGGGGGGGSGARRGGPKVGMPGVGKMRGAELRISARDVRDIEGRKAGPEKRKKKRR
ncbi:hypothetical protein RB601_003324 [Gaeumannomyces tritici]